MSPPDAGAVVKLGGSVVTDKGSERLRVDEDLVRDLARQLVSSGTRPLVVIHGAGSWGHRIVRRTGIHRGLDGSDGARLAMGETQRLQYELDALVAALLLDEGLPVFPLQASAMATMRGGELVGMALAPAAELLARGMVPLLYGVPAVDTERGCSILSGDQIAPVVAVELGIPRVIHATDVDGVFDADPHAVSGARRFARIHGGNARRVRAALGGSAVVDVTGGMAGKVGALLRWAEGGLRTRIVDARVPGRLAAALADEDVGTLVCWDEEEP